MIEVFGDAWKLSKGNILCITTNGQTNRRNACVMGKGIALQCAERFPELPFILGEYILAFGNHVFDLGEFGDWTIFSFPTNHHWKQNSSIELISHSIKELESIYESKAKFNGKNVYLPRPGCGVGGLNWEEVKPFLEHLDDRYYIVDRPNVV